MGARRWMQTDWENMTRYVRYGSALDACLQSRKVGKAGGQRECFKVRCDLAAGWWWEWGQSSDDLGVCQLAVYSMFVSNIM